MNKLENEFEDEINIKQYEIARNALLNHRQNEIARKAIKKNKGYNTHEPMKKLEKRVTDNAEIVIDNHRTAIDGVKRMMKSTKNDTEKRKLKETIASLENDIESIKSDGIEEFNRKKRILKRLNDLKAQFDALNKD